MKIIDRAAADRCFRSVTGRSRTMAIVLATLIILLAVLSVPLRPGPLGLAPGVKANSVYFNLATGNLSLSVTPATANQITANDDWSGVASVEGYFGNGLTATHGVDPQTVLNTEFLNSQLPNTPTHVTANKGNPSAFNAGGLAEFDGGTYLAIGAQGNVQANPYIVFYLNTTGRTGVTIGYTAQDIDGRSDNSVSSLALQYRVGETGNFTNIPAGYIADATDGGAAGRSTTKTVVLPAATTNKPQVQVRLITTNAADASGSSTPDEWIGLNNVLITSSAPTAANARVIGRVTDGGGKGIRGAMVTIQDAGGWSRTSITGILGYYRFADVPTGATYVFTVISKRHTFSSPSTARTVLDDTADVDFIADN